MRNDNPCVARVVEPTEHTLYRYFKELLEDNSLALWFAQQEVEPAYVPWNAAEGSFQKVYYPILPLVHNDRLIRVGQPERYPIAGERMYVPPWASTAWPEDLTGTLGYCAEDLVEHMPDMVEFYLPTFMIGGLALKIETTNGGGVDEQPEYRYYNTKKDEMANKCVCRIRIRREASPGSKEVISTSEERAT